jgi:hypothetical protein
MTISIDNQDVVLPVLIFGRDDFPSAISMTRYNARLESGKENPVVIESSGGGRFRMVWLAVAPIPSPHLFLVERRDRPTAMSF